MSTKLKPLKLGISLIITVILTLGFSISLQSLVAAWTAPSANPPLNNISDLTLGAGLGVSGNTALGGNFRIASGSVESLYVNNANGNIGIGTTVINANSKMQINPSLSMEGLRIVSASDYSPLNIRNNANTSDIFRIDQNGVVAVGTIPWARISNHPIGTLTTGKLCAYDGTSINCNTDPGGIGGTGTSGYIPKWTGAITQDNSLIYDNGTNVGIGTTDPAQKLDVNGAIRANNFYDANNGSYYVDPDGTSYLNKVTVTGVPTLGSDVATKSYVDSKIGTGVSLDGFAEVYFNVAEDTYSSLTYCGVMSQPACIADTCGDGATQFGCSVTDEKMCVDYISNTSCDGEGCWEYDRRNRNVVCKKSTILQKITQATFTKNLNSTDLWNLYGREMYGSGTNALTNATKICTVLYGMNYVSHTVVTHGTSCGGTYHVVNWNGSSFVWIGLGCGPNVTVLNSVSCSS